MPTTNKAPKVVVVGGSFAGLAACRYLSSNAEVTLIDPKEFFEYTPGILHVLTGSKSRDIIISPLKQVASKSTKILNGCFQGLSLKDQQVIVKSSSNDETINVPYDYLIIATGRGYGAPIKPASTTLTIKQRLSEIDTFIKKINDANNILVIGGGLVGVELAAELACRNDDDNNNNNGKGKEKSRRAVTLLARSTLLSTLPLKAGLIAKTWFRRNQVRVVLHDELKINDKNNQPLLTNDGDLQTKDGQIIKSDCYIDCTGNAPVILSTNDNNKSPSKSSSSSSSSSIPVLPLSPPGWSKVSNYDKDEVQFFSGGEIISPYASNGYVAVNNNLESINYPNIFAAGDVIQHASGYEVAMGHSVPNKWKFGQKFSLPMLRNAHLAESQAESISKLILNRNKNINNINNAISYTPYPQSVFWTKYTPALACVSLGPMNGIVVFNDLVIGGVILGFLGAFVKFFIERSKISEIRNEFTGRSIWAFAHQVTNTLHCWSVSMTLLFMKIRNLFNKRDNKNRKDLKYD